MKRNYYVLGSYYIGDEENVYQDMVERNVISVGYTHIKQVV
jgi:hypothetical protein